MLLPLLVLVKKLKMRAMRQYFEDNIIAIITPLLIKFYNKNHMYLISYDNVESFLLSYNNVGF